MIKKHVKLIRFVKNLGSKICNSFKISVFLPMRKPNKKKKNRKRSTIPKNNRGNKKHSPLKDTFLNSSFIITAILATLYLFGWTFLYHYFNHFHIGILELEFEYNEIIMWGSIGIVESLSLPMLWIGGGVLLAFYYILSCLNINKIIFLIIIFALLLAFIITIAYQSSVKKIEDMLAYGYPHLPLIKLTTKHPTYIAKETRIKKEKYLLLFRSKNNIYIIKRPENENNQYTWSIPLREVVEMRLFTPPESE